MPTAGEFINTLFALVALVVFGTFFGIALIWTALKLTDAGKEKAAAKSASGGRRNRGQRPSVTGSQTIQAKQTNSLRSKPRIKSGRKAL